MKAYKKHLLTALITGLLMATIYASGQKTAGTADLKLTSKEDAVSFALEMAGLNQFMSNDTGKIHMVRCDLVIDEDLPQLLQNNIINPVWIIELDSVVLNFSGKNDVQKDGRQWSLTIYIDAATGTPIQVDALQYGKEAVLNQMQSRHSEYEYTNYIDRISPDRSTEKPKISFLDAIGYIAFVSAGSAIELLGSYILYTDMEGNRLQSGWFIMMRGIGPLSASINLDRNYYYGTGYTIVDAQTGEQDFIMIGNFQKNKIEE